MICVSASLALLLIACSTSALSLPLIPSVESLILPSLVFNLTSSSAASFFLNVSSTPTALSSVVPPIALDATSDPYFNGPICDSRYGNNFNIDSCYSTLRSIRPWRDRVEFGDRGRGFPVQLPRRISSSESSLSSCRWGSCP